MGTGWLDDPGPRIVVDFSLVRETATRSNEYAKGLHIQGLRKNLVSFGRPSRPEQSVVSVTAAARRSGARRGDIPMAGFQTFTYGRIGGVHRGIEYHYTSGRTQTAFCRVSSGAW